MKVTFSFFTLVIINNIIGFNAQQLKANDFSLTKAFDSIRPIVILDYNYTDTLIVYDDDLNPMTFLKNNYTEEDFIVFTLLQKKNNMYEIIAHSSLSGDSITHGWIATNSFLTIGVQTVDMQIKLYKTPNYSQFQYVKCNSPTPKYRVIDCDSSWLKIVIREGENIYSGWIPIEEQCSLVYTICN